MFSFRNIFEHSEISLLKYSVQLASGVSSEGVAVDDGKGNKSTVSVWSHPGDDVTGLVAKCSRVVGVMRTILGSEVYHYYSKLVVSDPESYEEFSWFQDYK